MCYWSEIKIKMKEKRKESLGNSVWKEMEEEKEKAFGNRRRALNSCDHMLLSLGIKPLTYQHLDSSNLWLFS